MVKNVFAPHIGQHVKLGRLRPKDLRTQAKLRMSNYLNTKLPVAPSWVNYSYKAPHSLADIYGNDDLGDCVIAAGYHFIGTVTGNAGKEFHATNKQIISDYSAIGGYVPGKPETDQGCDEVTALNYWSSKGFADGSKLSAWVAVDATNEKLIQQCVYLFENLLFGFELPDEWVNHMPQSNGFVWDVKGRPNPDNGHAFLGLGYNNKNILIDTWGLLGYISYAAVAEYAANINNGELYVMLNEEIVNKAQKKAPNSFDWNTLLEDFKSL